MTDKLNEEAARWDSLRVNFTIVMWAILFFMPLPIPGFGLTPDILAWGLLLIGIGATVRHVAGLGLLWATAAAGLALWIVRALVGLPEGEETSVAAVVLYVGMWALVTAFAAQLASLIRRLAIELDADDLAHSVSWRAWLPVIPLVLFAVAPFLPKEPRVIRLIFGCVALLVTACVVSLVMGMAAGAARLFAHKARAAQTDGETTES